MAEQKTKPTRVTLEQFLAKVTPERRRDEARVLDEIFRRVTGHPPVLWGPSIVGYDQYEYRSPAGTTGVWPAAGFSPRKAALTLYVMDGTASQAKDLARLGKHKSSVSCLYVNKLEDIDLKVLEKIVKASYARVKRELDQAGKRVGDRRC
ncbi:MAG TPA: DUF1801 domain-containing protein [Gemmatimonadales bacterium]|nr:DUF1801 domain-containing protein [Gemmatimonadales bacterium]